MTHIRPKIRRGQVAVAPKVRKSPVIVQKVKTPPNLNKAARKIQRAWFGRGSYELIMFSGTAKIESPNLKSLFESPLNELVNEVSVRSGRKILATHTREYGIKTDLRSIYYDMLVFKGSVGTRAFAINVYKSGKITFTGGYAQGAKTIRSTPRTLLAKVLGVLEFDIKSSTVQFDSGLSFGRFELVRGGYDYNLRSVTLQLSRLGLPPGDISVPNRDPLNPLQTKPFITVNLHPEMMRIFPNGQVQVTKITTDAAAKKSVQSARVIMKSLEKSGAVQKRTFTPPKSRKTHAQSRGIPGISETSTTCPKNRRPTPYSFGGNPIGPGFYIGANPQGLPCCYKIPKKIGYLKSKIIQRFDELGIQIPPSTKLAFHINRNNSNKPVNVSGKIPDLPIFMDNGELKIGTRQAKRWTLSKLVDIAHKLGAVYITHKSSKDDVIAAIERESKKKNRFNVKNTMRIQGKRNIRHFTKAALVNRVRKVYGVRLNNSKPMTNLVANVKRLQNTRRFKELYNSIMPINRIPEEFKETFYNAAKNDYLGKSNEEVRKGLQSAKNHIMETLRL